MHGSQSQGPKRISAGFEGWDGREGGRRRGREGTAKIKKRVLMTKCTTTVSPRVVIQQGSLSIWGGKGGGEGGRGHSQEEEGTQEEKILAAGCVCVCMVGYVWYSLRT